VEAYRGRAWDGPPDLKATGARRNFVHLPRTSAGIAVRYPMRCGPPSAVASLGAAPGRAFHQTLIVNADGQWAVTVSKSQAGGLLAPGLQALFLLVGGAIVSALTFLLVKTLTNSRGRALRTVEDRTRQLRHQALHDSLTDLPNRKLLRERATQLLELAGPATRVAALFIDVDGFKTVNDTLGHLVGDELLCQVAKRISGALRSTDMVARMGGDEFVVLAVDDSAERVPQELARRVLEAMHQPFGIGAGAEPVLVPVTVSIGVAVGGSCCLDELLSDADIALYRAKTAGKDRYVMFSPEMRGTAQARAPIEARSAARGAEKGFGHPSASLADT